MCLITQVDPSSGSSTCVQDKSEGASVEERTLGVLSTNDDSDSNAADDGVMFTALRKGFLQAQQQEHREFEIATSVVEIYNERAVDLLNNRQELQIRHHRVNGFYLQGMKRTVCTDVAEATQALKRALAYRFAVPMLSRNHWSECTASTWTYTWASSGVPEHTR